MSAIDSALSKSRAMIRTTSQMVNQKGGISPDLLVSPYESSGLGSFSTEGAIRRKYASFRGHVYAAVNALALEGAVQPVVVGRMTNTKKKPNPKKSSLDHILNKMPSSMRTKIAKNEIDIEPTHPIVKFLEKPNSVQMRFQFAYSFIANLALTGWGYLVAGESEDGKPEVYSLPSNWVKPIHDKGPFAQFKIVNPQDPGSEASAVPLDKSQVAFAYLPDPGNPIQALAPSTAQSLAIKIDENIQQSQSAFFDNGIFPSVIVTIGKNPHPDVPGGIRPRLSAPQRRQVYAAIKKVSGGIANYGNPAIVDGMIEKIERLSATQIEMGWEKSEKTIRSRILSAYGVHPFILGEEMPGSYAQAYIVQSRFGVKINCFLALLSQICTSFLPGLFEEVDEDLLIWWEKFEPIDPSMKQSLWSTARSHGDINQNEFRAFMGLPPDDDSNPSYIDKSSANATMAIARDVKAGVIDVEQGISILEGMGIPSDLAVRIAGSGPPAGGAVDAMGNPIPAGEAGSQAQTPNPLESGHPVDQWEKPPAGWEEPTDEEAVKSLQSSIESLSSVL